MNYLSGKKIAKKFILGAVCLIVSIIFLISVLISTPAGSHWVVRRIALLSDANLGNIKGNLLTGLDIASLELQQSNLHLHAENISFRWQPLALIYTAVSVQSLTAQKIRVTLTSAQHTEKNITPAAHFQWPNLALPVRIELNKVQLKDIHLQQGDKHVTLNSLSGSFSLGTFHLRISNLAIDNSQAHLSTQGTLGLAYPYALNFKSQWELKPAAALMPNGTPSSSELKISGEANINGNIKKINIQHHLLHPLMINTTASISPALNDANNTPYVDISSQWQTQVIPHALINRSNSNTGNNHFNFLAALLTTEGHLQLQGGLERYTLQGEIKANTHATELSAAINITGTQTTDVNHLTSQFNWQINKLLIASQTLANPALANQTLSNQTLVNQISNNPNTLVEKNNLQLTGNVHWNQALNWNLRLNGEHINAGQFFPEFPSDVSLAIAATGELKNLANFSAKNLRVAISDLNISGELRDLHFTTQGAVEFDGAHWQSSNINLALGANQLAVKGKAGTDVALEWKINAPLLHQIDPSIKGSIISSGAIRGSLSNTLVTNNTQAKNPFTISLAAQIKQFSWRDYSIENLTFTLKPTHNDYHLLLTASHLQLQGQRVAQINISGNGSIAQHNLIGELQSPDYGAIEFNLDSRWENGAWQGRWRNFSVALKKIPRWYLLSSDLMQADKNYFELPKLCLTSADQARAILNANNLPQSNINTHFSNAINGKPLQKSSAKIPETPSICLASHWRSNQEFSLNINALAMPIHQARTFFKPEVTLSGVVDAQASLHAVANTPLAADLQVQTRDVQFIYQFQGGNTEVYPLKKGTINVTLKNHQATTFLLMDWDKYGIIHAENKYNLTDKKIQGKVTAELPDLAPLESLLPTLNNVHGSATAAFNIMGTINKPEITGNFTLTDGSANLPKLGLEVTEIALQLTSNEANLILVDGQLLSGEGRLMLKGSLANMGAENWECHGNIFGAGIRIIQQTPLSATISPNLTFTANANAINLKGSTEIPWARAAIKTLPESATRVSSDVTILEASHYAELSNTSYANATFNSRAKNSIPFYTNVILYFGDDVRFKGFGLDGQLSGKINVFKEENRQALTTGFVAINHGNYKAYGQELSIERGRLIFQGPYDNPGLDIRAVRSIEAATSGETTNAGQTIIAGLEIGGTLQHPKSTVFAIPTLDDSKAMALLLTGKALDQLSPGDAYSIIAAVGSMGVENGSSITADIARFFRIDEITIKADKGLDQSVLWLGKYVTPKLFVRYVVGLFDQAFTLGMRYQITEKLRLEAESGKTQSLDIIYKIER